MQKQAWCGLSYKYIQVHVKSYHFHTKEQAGPFGVVIVTEHINVANYG